MKNIFMALALLLSGCASTDSVLVTTDTILATADTMRIIEQAAEVAPYGVKGNFSFTIKAAAKPGEIVYLNTELDYRDRRCITIALSPKVASHIEQQYGVTAQEYYLGKKIQVNGTAKQVKIWFFERGKRTDKYYYQTHIRIIRPKQIEVLG
jgi:hypothetical protein